MINYEEMYSQMSDEELLRLAERQSSLVDEAREAVCAELQKRGGVAAILDHVKESPRIEPADKAGADIISNDVHRSVCIAATLFFPAVLIWLLSAWEELNWFPKHYLDPESRLSLLMWVIILFFFGPFSFVTDLLERKKP